MRARATLLFALGALGCGEVARCDLQALMDARVPVGAEDCGVSALDDDADVAHCLAVAFVEGRPASGTTQRSAPDGTLSAKGVVVDTDSVIIFDATFTGCTDEGCRGVVRRVPCREPEAEGPADAQRIVCATDASPCGKVVCGEGVDCDAGQD